MGKKEIKDGKDPLEAEFSVSKHKTEKVPPVSFLKLFRYASVLDKFLLTLGVIFTAGSALCRPLNMLVFGRLTGSVINYASKISYGEELSDEEKDQILETFIGAVTTFAIFNSLIGFAMLIFTHLSVLIFNYTALKQIYKVRTLYFNSVLNQDIAWHDTNQTGDFASRMSEDLNKFEDGIGEKVPLFLHSMFTTVACITLALVRGWELALICLSSLPLTLISLSAVSKITSKIAKEELDAYGAAGAIAEEVLTNIRTVVAFSGESKELSRYENKLLYARNNNIKRSLLSGIGFGLLWFFNYAIYALAFWYGINLILKEMHLPENERVYTAGNMVTVFFSVMEGSTNFGMVAPYIETFGIAKAAAAKVFSVIDKQPIINKSKTTGKKMWDVRGRIVFKNVYFNYPSRQDVKILQGVNLTIEPGQTVALVGSSGCGKSTCIQLLQRFYDPTRGTITLDGIDLKDLNLTWLRNNFGVVGQEPVLFGMTVAENIRMGNRTATKEEIERAARKANAHDFIVTLPQGYDTLVTGAQLSGGQKQRIAIARALVREPAVLLLDEATSALDTDSEAKVQAALDVASKGCTTIIVAHRLSTIRGANKIIVFMNGNIVEEGSYQDLMDRKGQFYELALSQSVSPDLDEEEDTNEDLENVEEYIEPRSSLEEDGDEYECEINDQEIIRTKKSKKVNPSSLWSVIKMNNTEWWQIFLGCLTSIITGCALPIFAVLFGDILGILSNPDGDYIHLQTNRYCVYFVIMALVTGPATFIQIYMFGIAGEKLVLRLRKQMFGAMLRQEIGWYDVKENSVGNLCSRLSSEASSVQGATGQRIGTILQSLATLCLGVSLSMYFEWRLGLVTIAFAPFVLIATFFQKRLQASRDPGSGSPLEKSTKIAIEAVSNIRTVVSLGNENLFYTLYTSELMKYYKVAKRSIHIRALVLALARSLLDFAFSTCIYYGGILIRDEHLNYANVFKVAQSLIFGTVSIANALAFTPNFQKGLTAATRIFNLLRRVPKIKDNADNLSDAWEMGNIEFSKIHFRYPTRPMVKVLNGLNLSILNGKTVALVGSSGCGKSTIIQLLERFYDPQKGHVSVDHKKLANMKLSSLRSHLGIVSQEPNLFDRTIAENIAYGANNREVSKDEILEAAKQANIHNFVTSLPLGYETRLGEKGAQLSGGQKQRIAIARALVRNPKVLLLDEATSALDNESEKIVQQALDKARQGRTCITIAHRLTTVQDADIICVVNAGKITEMGSHSELMRKKGLYEKLYTLQMAPRK